MEDFQQRKEAAADKSDSGDNDYVYRHRYKIILLIVVACIMAAPLVAFGVWGGSGRTSSSEGSPFRTRLFPTKRVHSLGAVEIAGTTYACAIDKASFVCKYLGHSVYRIARVSLHALDNGPKAIPMEAVLVEDYLSMAGFYFSPTCNLSLNVQAQEEGECSGPHAEYFIANHHMLSVHGSLKMTEDKLKMFRTVKAIRGHVAVGSYKVLGDGRERIVRGMIVSRTCTKRTSTRFHSRGGDLRGNVSNFVETEMAIFPDVDGSSGQKASFVQVRGSMPFRWRQVPAIHRPSPDLMVCEDDVVNEAIFGQHMERLKTLYPLPARSLLLLNLVDQKMGAREATAGRKYTEIFEKYKHDSNAECIHYLSFDYHAEQDKNPVGWLHHMLQLIKEQMKLTFYCSSDGKQLQQSLVRVNCVDCLDRTNAVQSFMAMHDLLPAMLRSLAIDCSPQDLASFQQMMGQFWADNAGAISLQYAGTAALKTDMARTGRRTLRGGARDMYSSVQRHFNANYYDRFRRVPMEIVYGPDSVDQPDNPASTVE